MLTLLPGAYFHPLAMMHPTRIAGTSQYGIFILLKNDPNFPYSRVGVSGDSQGK